MGQLKCSNTRLSISTQDFQTFRQMEQAIGFLERHGHRVTRCLSEFLSQKYPDLQVASILQVLFGIPNGEFEFQTLKVFSL